MTSRANWGEGKSLEPTGRSLIQPTTAIPQVVRSLFLRKERRVVTSGGGFSKPGEIPRLHFVPSAHDVEAGQETPEAETLGLIYNPPYGVSGRDLQAS